VLAGGFAHELSHVLRDSRLRRAKRVEAFGRYSSSDVYRRLDERQTDLEVIRRGYGRQLLAFILYVRAFGYEWLREDGLTICRSAQVSETGTLKPQSSNAGDLGLMVEPHAFTAYMLPENLSRKRCYHITMSGDDLSASTAISTIWLSGPILTFASKVAMPVMWLALLIGVPIWVYITAGHISIRSDFQFIVWFTLIATLILGWVTVHLQLAGYRGRELMVANYWREARIPFEAISEVERVWWYKGRLVRIRFNRKTPFGSVVYYMPKWGPFRALISAPEEELRRIIANSN
jgi:hypothetical protein